MGAAGDWCRLRPSKPSGDVRAAPVGSIPTRSRHPGRHSSARWLRAPFARSLRAALVGTLLAVASGAGTPGAAPAQEPAEADTAAAPEPVRGPSAEPDTTPSPPISPLGAFARSIVLPGWGQAEVDQPFRGAIYFAAEAASLWMVFKTQTKLSAARRAAPQDTSALVDARVSQREDWLVLSVFWALMSGVDAWVSTHLYGFEGQLEPPEDGTPGAQVSYSIPLDLP